MYYGECRKALKKLRQDFDQRVYEERRKKGWTIQQVQEQCGFPSHRLEKIELGQIELCLSQMNYLASVLGKRLHITWE